VNKPVNIVADIGGTNARFACISENGNALYEFRNYACADFKHFREVILTYLQDSHIKQPGRICIAVAGVVERDWIDLPNNHFAFSQQLLQEQLGLEIIFINDFTAQLKSIGSLVSSELHWLGRQRPTGRFIHTAVGPGTGLGVAGQTASGDIIPSEGGHFAWAPLNRHEYELLALCWRRFPRVSVERILSGPGLSMLYWANAILHGQERELRPADITDSARGGDPVALAAVGDFIRILGSVAGDIAIVLGALDGIYLMGDMLMHFKGLYKTDMLRNRFNDKGRYSDYCAGIPLAMVEASNTGLRGCVAMLEATRRDRLFTQQLFHPRTVEAPGPKA
jgi:glucokinase